MASVRKMKAFTVAKPTRWYSEKGKQEENISLVMLKIVTYFKVPDMGITGEQLT